MDEEKASNNIQYSSYSSLAISKKTLEQTPYLNGTREKQIPGGWVSKMVQPSALDSGSDRDHTV